MFPFDHAALPQLTTRKALLLVDLQNDFVGPDGALPVSEPPGFVGRAVELAAAFRSTGDVVWVQSRFEEARPVIPERIVAADAAPGSAAIEPATRPSSRIRRRPPVLEVDVEPDEDPTPAGPPDPEAFLSHDEATCVKASSPGCDMPPAVKAAVHKGDLILSKTHYSAFQATHLLRMLRAKMVIEVFICGSLANIGVFATALDAAGHGMAITVVEDCCGYRNESRQVTAVKKLIELTGCEIASYKEVLDTIQPLPPAKAPSKTPSSKPSAPSSTGSKPAVGRASMSPDIVRPMTTLRLASDSPSPTVTDTPPSTLDAVVSAPVKDPGPQDAPSNLGQVVEAKQKIETDTQDDKKSSKVARDVAEPGVSGIDSNPQTPPSEENPPPTSPLLAATLADEDVNGKSNPDPDSGDEREQQRELGDGDTDVIEDLLPASLEEGIFEKLRDEIRWQRMSHQGGEVPRLVAVQGEVAEDGSIPIYRHPADESPPLLPFSPTVMAIKAETEKHLGHPLNHVLVQHYRDGTDYISEHSDKTLDIVRGSYIANVSLGAQRTMVLRTKRPDKDPSRTAAPAEGTTRRIERIRLPHNSLCRMGLRTNMKWLHAIRQDKRADRDKTAPESAYSGARISLTFRNIGTFLNRDETVIWGQGATGKTLKDATAVINGQTPEAIKMLQAFGTENHASAFDWDFYYGKGFDVLHMSNAPRLFASADSIVNMRIGLMLAEFGIAYAKGSMGQAIVPTAKASDSKCSSNSTGDCNTGGTPPGLGSVLIKFVDNDAGKSVVEGDIAIMLYLDSCYGQGKAGVSVLSQPEFATRFTRFQKGVALLDKWRLLDPSKDEQSALKSLRLELAHWDGYVAEGNDDFLAGPIPSLPDFAVWPVLHAMNEEHGEELLGSMSSLKKYYEKMADRESTKKAMGPTATRERSREGVS